MILMIIESNKSQGGANNANDLKNIVKVIFTLKIL